MPKYGKHVKLEQIAEKKQKSKKQKTPQLLGDVKGQQCETPWVAIFAFKPGIAWPKGVTGQQHMRKPAKAQNSLGKNPCTDL